MQSLRCTRRRGAKPTARVATLLARSLQTNTHITIPKKAKKAEPSRSVLNNSRWTLPLRAGNGSWLAGFGHRVLRVSQKRRGPRAAQSLFWGGRDDQQGEPLSPVQFIHIISISTPFYFFLFSSSAPKMSLSKPLHKCGEGGLVNLDKGMKIFKFFFFLVFLPLCKYYKPLTLYGKARALQHVRITEIAAEKVVKHVHRRRCCQSLKKKEKKGFTKPETPQNEKKKKRKRKLLWKKKKNKHQCPSILFVRGKKKQRCCVLREAEYIGQTLANRQVNQHCLAPLP